MTAEFSAEFVQRERARSYAWGRFDAESLRYVPAQDFVDAVMDQGTSVGGFRGLYNRMVTARAVRSLAGVDTTKQAA